MNHVEVKIVQYLDELGFKHSLLGFKYTVMLILHCLENPDDVYRICKTYELCAQKIGVKATHFERAIRHEIRIHAQSDLTNKEFIARAVDDLSAAMAYERKNTRKPKGQ